MADKIMKSITKDALGTDGKDIDVVVETNKITTKSENSKIAPLRRAINIEAIARNKAAPLEFKVIPIVRTKFDIRGSLFNFWFMQRKVVGSVIALKSKILTEKISFVRSES